MVSLTLDNLGASYGRTRILDGISTGKLEGGCLTAVVGPNAAGKSTLFKRIAGLIKGDGKATLEGSKRGRDGICYMPQDTGANAVLTVYESIVLASRQGAGWRVGEGDLAEIDRLLESLNIANLAFRNLGELSGGQRQLVAIAQALDLHRQIEVLDFMRRLAAKRGMAVLIAIHDLNHALRYCDQTLVIANGRLIASGRTADIVTARMLRETYRIDARIETCSQGLPHVIVDAAA